MSDVSSPRVREIFNIMEMVRKNFDENGLSEIYRDELEYLHIEHLRLYGMFRFIRSEAWNELYDKSEEVMNRYYPSWRKNPYIKNLNLKNRIFLKCYSKLTARLFHKVIR